MDATDVRVYEERTRAFAIAVIQLHRVLKSQPELWGIAGQLSRAANSVAANHRAMSRARSIREFAAKLHTVHEEADEAAHWLGVLKDCEIDPALSALVAPLLNEAVRLRNFFGRARATTRRRHFSN